MAYPRSTTVECHFSMQIWYIPSVPTLQKLLTRFIDRLPDGRLHAYNNGTHDSCWQHVLPCLSEADPLDHVEDLASQRHVQ